MICRVSKADYPNTVLPYLCIHLPSISIYTLFINTQMGLQSSCAFAGHLSRHCREGHVAIENGMELEARIMKFTTLFMQNNVHLHASSLPLNQHAHTDSSFDTHHKVPLCQHY